MLDDCEYGEHSGCIVGCESFDPLSLTDSAEWSKSEPYEGHFAALHIEECELSSLCVPYLGQQQIRCQGRSASDSGLQMHRACKMTA